MHHNSYAKLILRLHKSASSEAKTETGDFTTELLAFSVKQHIEEPIQK